MKERRCPECDDEDYGYYACQGQGDLIVMIRLAILDAEED